MRRSRDGRRWLESGKGGTAVILSALRAMRDLSGLRQETGASAVPCDPGRCFMACSRSLSVWEKTGRAYLCVCVSVCQRRCLFGSHAVSVTKAIKRAGPNVHDCEVCVYGCGVSQFLPAGLSRGCALVCLECVCVCVRARLPWNLIRTINTIRQQAGRFTHTHR